MESRFTASDALALDVEQVERWANEVIRDGDAPTDLLVSLVVRLRNVYDLLAEYLFQTSKAQGEAGADADVPLARRPAPPPRAEARGTSERERAGSSKALGRESRTPSGATPSGQPSKPSPPPGKTRGGLHE